MSAVSWCAAPAECALKGRIGKAVFGLAERIVYWPDSTSAYRKESFVNQEQTYLPPATVEEFDELLKTVINDPATSFWLRQALESMLKRDPLDFLNDSQLLLTFAAQRAGLVREEAKRMLAVHGG